MARSRWLRRQSTNLVRLAVLLALAAVTLFPLAWIVTGSLKPLEQVFAIPVQWVPDPIQPQNYPDAIQATDFSRPLLNSVIVTSSQVAINLVLCSLAGFGFAKYRFRGREQLFLGVLAMTLLPLQVIMIPLFLIVKGLGWVNTYQGLILPTAASANSCGRSSSSAAESWPPRRSPWPSCARSIRRPSTSSSRSRW